MRNLPLAVVALLTSVTAFGAFEKIAYVDSIDYGAVFETETDEGSERIVDHVLNTGATTLLWRNQSGAVPTYPSAEEAEPLKEPPLDKRRIPMSQRAMGWIRYDDCGTDPIRAAREACVRRGVRFGIHVTTEENHCSSWTLGAWNLEHPEYWCCRRNDMPFPLHCSRAFPEVRKHKRRLFAELLAYKPVMMAFDSYRSGGWSPAWEYVEPVLRGWRKLYGCEPPADARDPKWAAFVAKYMTAYYKGLRAMAQVDGRPVELVMTVESYGASFDYNLINRGSDWREMLRQGIIDAVAIACIELDWNDPWGFTARLYGEAVRDAKACRPDAKVFFPIMAYNFRGRPGYLEYAKRCGIAPEDAVARLLRLSKEAGGDGITMEVVDYGNYSPEVCRVIRDFK